MKTTPDFRIREAEAKDGNGILACLQAAFARYRAEYTPEAFADTVLDSETIKVRLRDMHVFVAILEERIVGTIGCAINEKEGHLRGMAVHPDLQGTEVGLRLLREVEKQLRKSGCTFVTLDTTEPLKRATRFYEKNGFSASGRVSDFFGMQLYQYTKSLSDGM
jgi:N-acetylglutamate synthase-like GNAT family acetyltransferase